MSRWLLLVFCFLCILQEAGTVYSTSYVVGQTGIVPVGSLRAFEWKLSITADSAAAQAGVHGGDVVDARALAPQDRFRVWTHAPIASIPIVLQITRDGGTHTFTVVPRHASIDWALAVAMTAGFWSALCAIVLLVRRPDSGAVQILVLYLLLVRLGIQMGPTNWVSQSAAFDAVSAALNYIAPAGWALLALYVSRFAPSNKLVRFFALASYALATYIAIVGASAVVGAWFGWFDPRSALFTGTPWRVAQLAYLIAPIACAIVVLRAIRGEERIRLVWLLAPTVVIYMIYQSYRIWGFLPFFRYDAVDTTSLVLQLLAPLGMTYAMLNRRLLDIGFVLNRAAVYAVVSVVVVGMFILAEWAFSEWFAAATHTENLLLNAALVLVLGLSVRTIHQRVDALLDHVFFRKRHEDEMALRQFGREAPYITDTSTLLERAKSLIEERADATFATFALADGHGHYGSIDENDPAIVSMRTSQKAVDLQLQHSALQGEYAYPLVARGRMLGALAIGAKRSGESFAPDEREALEALVYGVANALDTLTQQKSNGESAVLAGIYDIRTALSGITKRLDAR